jgi:hypothetical protein
VATFFTGWIIAVLISLDSSSGQDSAALSVVLGGTVALSVWVGWLVYRAPLLDVGEEPLLCHEVFRVTRHRVDPQGRVKMPLLSFSLFFMLNPVLSWLFGTTKLGHLWITTTHVRFVPIIGTRYYLGIPLQQISSLYGPSFTAGVDVRKHVVAFVSRFVTREEAEIAYDLTGLVPYADEALAPFTTVPRLVAAVARRAGGGFIAVSTRRGLFLFWLSDVAALLAAIVTIAEDADANSASIAS